MKRRTIGLALVGTVCMQLAVGQTKNLKTNTDSVSYALGMDVGSSLAGQGITIQSESFLKGFNDGLAEHDGLIGREEGIRVIKAAFAKAAEEKAARLKATEIAFMDSVKNIAGIQSLEEGLYYQVLQEGTGAKPTVEDEVTVHYKGSLTNGKVFDDSRERGEPLDAPC